MRYYKSQLDETPRRDYAREEYDAQEAADLKQDEKRDLSREERRLRSRTPDEAKSALDKYLYEVLTGKRTFNGEEATRLNAELLISNTLPGPSKKAEAYRGGNNTPPGINQDGDPEAWVGSFDNFINNLLK